ncbi:ABC transporter permease [Rhodobacter sp. SGA-6-6]|uniref:ABC transporter permease n=1 Tax=Rhodobacter sp. SGA-6-6 TaxID=2710882 RepID=UPI0013EE3BAE|nr:ABC transporter permease [Rhodobacter sp. SGA-6-6]NGM45532.1 ABC transporter permease [Rhodobacter sp. SGA-6-6]
MSRWFSLTRLFALLRKEVIQLRRDRITFAMMLGVPLMQLMLFGYAINSDPKQLPAALVAPTQDRFSRAIVTALELTDYYRFTSPGVSAAEAERLLARGEVAFVVTLPSDFGRRVLRGDRPVMLIEADATDPSVASGAVSTLGTVASEALQRELGTEAQAGAARDTQLQVLVHRRYNPEGITAYNIVPGLLGVILQLTMVMMTAMALTREIERGTMENLLSMPATPLEIMLGKMLPYLGVSAVQVLVVLVAARALFHVPFVGSLALLLGGILIFVMALLVLGYLISTVARTQMQAMQLTFFFFLPSLMLSGFMFPFRGMPGWAQALGEIFPLTHFLRFIRAVMLKGAGPEAVAQPLAALAVFAATLTLLALLRFRQTLD